MSTSTTYKYTSPADVRAGHWLVHHTNIPQGEPPLFDVVCVSDSLGELRVPYFDLVLSPQVLDSMGVRFLRQLDLVALAKSCIRDDERWILKLRAGGLTSYSPAGGGRSIYDPRNVRAMTRDCAQYCRDQVMLVSNLSSISIEIVDRDEAVAAYLASHRKTSTP